MSALELLSKIKPVWLHRVSHNMARGAALREDFERELQHFYAQLEHTVASGDPSWLDATLREWSATPALSHAEQGLTALLGQMIDVTNDVACEMLAGDEALQLLSTLIPIYTQWWHKASHLEMEARIAQVSKELSDLKLQFEQLDRSKSNFISVAAHELKTPLTLVEGYASMMKDMVVNENQEQLRDLLFGVQRGVTRLHEIISDMIDVSVIDTGMLLLNYQQTTIAHILKVLQIDLQAILKERSQRLTVHAFPGNDTWLFADSERIYQALHNLLTNAIKYTPDHGQIDVSGRTLPGFIEVTIQDTGIGIAPEHQTSIFEKFTQVGPANHHSSGKTKYKGGGPGLGLPIARGIIEAHGGSIWVDSPGFDEANCPGATFHVLLPIQQETPRPPRAEDPGLQFQPEK